MAMRWYIIHAYSGFEKKVAQAIKESAAQRGITHMFEDVVVPTEEVVEVRRGKKNQRRAQVFPGLRPGEDGADRRNLAPVSKPRRKLPASWAAGGKPQPISEAEAESIFRQVKEGIEHPKNSIIYEIGESVKVTEGPFESFVGVVEEVRQRKKPRQGRRFHLRARNAGRAGIHAGGEGFVGS